jgi:hypothetical protein
MSEIDEFLKNAAHDANGEPVFIRVQGRKGQWFVTPMDPHGGVLSFWGPPNTQFADDAFRDEQGNVLMGFVFLHNGSIMPTPLDASLRPVLELEVLVTKEGGTESPNPGGWPLTEEELDATKPPVDPPNLPDWQRQAMADVARDDLGQPLTTRVRAADGGWADVLMTNDGEPLRIEVDIGQVAGATPDGRLSPVSLMRGLGALVVVALDPHNRPVRSPESLREPDGEAG